jgi:preprotein translocase subunit SecF
MDLEDLKDLTEDVVHAARSQGTASTSAARRLEKAWDLLPGSRGNRSVLTTRDQKYSFVAVVPSVPFSDIGAGRVLLGKVQEEVRALNPDESDLEIRYAGWLPVIQETHNVMKRSLKQATILALSLGILMITIFTRQLIAPLLIGLALAPGLVWSLALAQFFVGQVNIITGFCIAILIGLGIDFGVHLFTRFRQSSIHQEEVTVSVVAGAVRNTFRPALASSLTTAGVFFTFTISEFRGFSEFGLIAGMGVISTFLSCFAILPPLLVLWYGRRALPPERPGREFHMDIAGSGTVGRSGVVVILFGILAILGSLSISGIPFHNDLKKLRGRSPVTEFTDYVDRNLDTGFNPAVFVLENLQDASQAAQLAQEAGEKKSSRIRRVLSLTDLLPGDTAERQELISTLVSALRSGYGAGGLIPGRSTLGRIMWQTRNLQKTPWDTDDVPDVLRRRFITQKGTGYLIYLWPEGDNDSDEKAAAWEADLRQLSEDLQARGIRHHFADETLMLVWIQRLVEKDGPLLLSVSFILVLLVLFADTRRVGTSLLVACPLVAGMLTLSLIVRLKGMELNMYNMVVLPSLIGIGIDNAVHIYHRYRAEGKGSVPLVVNRTGFAAMLASATTACGFGAVFISPNLGLRSFSTLAVLGIATLFLSTVLFFPSLLTLLERRKGTPRRENMP